MGIFGKNDNQAGPPPQQALRDIGERIASLPMSEHASRMARRELEALGRMDPSSADYSIGVSYLNYLVSMPWGQSTPDLLDIGRAARVLDERHRGLERAKERILEHLAVMVLKSASVPSILIVDDEEVARKNLKHLIEKDGFDTHAASNAEEALRMMNSRAFDVLLTDIRMEGINGLDLMQIVRLKHPDTKIILITAYASLEAAVEAIKNGAFHYITKPFKIDDVRKTVRDAVSARTITMRGPVLCFAGPPGTGKTSLCRAIAEAMGRKFVRISLGGLRDEADIRGHRRTYAGAMPGRIIEELRRSGVINPLISLDEADKIEGDKAGGDPSSALLEALDPEQNTGFTDHYLDIPFDLSKVMFIVTVNVPDNMPAALRDRMEVIEFTGYTEDEKIGIAVQHIIPKQLRQQGLGANPPVFTEDALSAIIRGYTREAGIRELERQISSVTRKIALGVVTNKINPSDLRISGSDVASYLGRPLYQTGVSDSTNRVGVATGLVRTESGGDIISVEAACMRGEQKLILTGSLGVVMQESAQAALSYIRSNTALFGLDEDFFEGSDIHVHVPAGAIQKDGPSAGATIAASLVSLLSGKPLRGDMAVSGEITLSGQLLAVGGVREKLMAAKRAGLKTVLLPLSNRHDVEALPENVHIGVSVEYFESIPEVIKKMMA